MSTQPQDPEAQRDKIVEHLEAITARWDEIPGARWLELRALDPNKNKTAQWNHFDTDDMAAAADWAAHWSGKRFGVYAVINPLREDAPDWRAAHDEDIAGSLHHWCDCDDEASATRLKELLSPRCTHVVLTGRTPHQRPHGYWELEAAVTDMEAWTARQKAIAVALGSDRSVVNPARIMRVAGTVNWPSREKAEKRGRIPEIVTLHQWPQRPHVTPDQIAQAFQAKAVERDHDGIQIDTGEHESINRAKLRADAAAGIDWRNNVFSLVASYAARGHTQEEIETLILPLTQTGYSHDDTRRDVAEYLSWVREKGDAAKDWSAEKAGWVEPDPDKVEPLPWQAWAEIDLAAIPRVRFAYSDFYALGYSSVTIAAPKTGKSMLGLAEAIDAATGRGFLTGVPREPQTVVYYNAEDDQNVINARVAALLTHYGIAQSEIAGRLYAVSGVATGDFVMVSGDDGIIREDVFLGLEKFIAKSDARILIFDPLQDLSDSPETNEVFRRLGRRLRQMASTLNVAVGLIHHTRKIAPGLEPTIDDGRGGSALRGTARFNRILAPMTEDEAAKAGVTNHRWFMRIADAESNLAPPSAEVNRWYQKVSVETPSGEQVGAVEKWQWPDAFEGVGPEQARDVQKAVANSDPPLRENVQSKAWVGHVVGAQLGIDTAEKQGRARVSQMLKTWIKNGVLAVEKHWSPRDGREIAIVVRGPTTPGNE